MNHSPRTVGHVSGRVSPQAWAVFSRLWCLINHTGETLTRPPPRHPTPPLTQFTERSAPGPPSPSAPQPWLAEGPSRASPGVCVGCITRTSVCLPGGWGPVIACVRIICGMSDCNLLITSVRCVSESGGGRVRAGGDRPTHVWSTENPHDAQCLSVEAAGADVAGL